VTASEDRTVRLWNPVTGKERRSLEGHENKVVHVSVSPDGRRAASLSRDATLLLWDLAE
jgi:WD40 repeat protein